jgi:sulfoquinovosidase
VWDFKGKAVPIITVEGGVGRGLEPLTAILNTFYNHAGGSELTSYSASWTYLSSRKHHVSFDTSALGLFKFDKDRTKIYAWHENTIKMRLGYGKTIKDLAAKQSLSLGTMKALPGWALDGAIVSMQGGST